MARKDNCGQSGQAQCSDIVSKHQPRIIANKGLYNNAVVSASGVIFAACYLLWMFQRVMYGTNDNPENHHLRDLTKSEYWQLVPLAVLIIWIGVSAQPFMKYSESAVRAVVSKVEQIKFSRTTTATLPSAEARR